VKKRKRNVYVKVAGKSDIKLQDFHFQRYNTTKTAEQSPVCYKETRQDILNFLNRYEKKGSIVDQRNGDFLPINHRCKWILCTKNGGINLQLFLDCTCKYLIDASINSARPTFFIRPLKAGCIMV
jgi:hypothetical protein